MKKYQTINNWVIKDNCFSIKCDKYSIRIEKLLEDNVICIISKNSNNLNFNFPNFESAFGFANEFIEQKNFDKKIDSFHISDDLKNKLSEIYNP